VLKNMSKRAAEILKDDMEARGPVKLTDAEWTGVQASLADVSKLLT